MTFEEIKKANETIVTTDVKGKQYAEVNQRIKAFRMLYPEGSIATNIERLGDGVVVMSCEARDEEGKLLGKAYAYEKENSTFINKTSYIENCCTSATGRALAYCGIGIDTSIASKEEVENAIKQQEEEDQLQKEYMELLAKFNKLVLDTDTEKEKLYEYYGVANNSEMTKDQLKDAVKKMETKLAKKVKK